MRGRAATPEAEKARRQKISRAMKKLVKIRAYRDERGRFTTKEKWESMNRAREVLEITPEIPAQTSFVETTGTPGQRKVLIGAGYRIDGTNAKVSHEEYVRWIYPYQNNPRDLANLLDKTTEGRVHFRDPDPGRPAEDRKGLPRVIEWDLR